MLTAIAGAKCSTACRPGQCGLLVRLARSAWNCVAFTRPVTWKCRPPSDTTVAVAVVSRRRIAAAATVHSHTATRSLVSAGTQPRLRAVSTTPMAVRAWILNDALRSRGQRSLWPSHITCTLLTRRVRAPRLPRCEVEVCEPWTLDNSQLWREKGNAWQPVERRRVVNGCRFDYVAARKVARSVFHRQERREAPDDGTWRRCVLSCPHLSLDRGTATDRL